MTPDDVDPDGLPDSDGEGSPETAAEPGQQTGPPLDARQLQERAIQGASWTMFHTLVSVPLAFGVNIVIARVLGVIDYGRLAFLSTVMDIAGGVISLGVGVGLVQFGARAHARGDRDAVKNLLRSAQGFRLLVEAPIIALLVIALVREDTVLLAIALIFGVFIPAFISGATTTLGIENKTAADAKNAMVTNLVTQVAVIITVLMVGTADAIWSVRLATGSVAIALALLWVSPDYRRAILQPQSPRKFPPGFWPFSLPAGAAGVLGTLVVSRTEVVLLSWMNQPIASGLFALAFGLAGHLFSPAQALIGPLIPAVSGLREVDSDSLRSAFNRTIRGTSTVVALMVGSALPAFASLVPLLYGDQFRAAAPILILLGVSAGVLVLSGPVSAFVQSRLNGWPLLRINLLALVVDVALALALIPMLGVWGAAIANVSAAALRFALLARGELIDLAVSVGAMLRMLLPLACGAFSAVAAYWASSYIPEAILAALTAGLLGLALTASLLWLLRSGFTQPDSDAVVSAMPVRLRPGVALVLRTFTHSRED